MKAPLFSNIIQPLICHWAIWFSGKDFLRPLMPTDLDKYHVHLKDMDLSESEKAEVIHALYAIMESFADRAFGLHSVQLAVAEQSKGDSAGASARVESVPVQSKHQFNAVARLTEQQEDTQHEGECTAKGTDLLPGVQR